MSRVLTGLPLVDISLYLAVGEEEDTTIKSSLAYIQLEKQNERLKEALIRHVCSNLLRCIF